MDEDFMVALQLQEHSKKRKIESGGNGIPWTNRVERPMSIVDESWEILDPSPDVRAMFLEFNAMFFEGKLSGVEVKWSPRMTLCAGVCSYEGRGGLCSIRLSEPLLKLRPRRDLVQTLLHEMIHALLFVTQNNRDRDGHGPEFCKHMERINTATGTKITVYHSFTDEVDLYRQHWWKCDGPCQHRKPYFGFVKRAMNRAPSANDPWWGDHQRTCGGTYNKVKEPEGYGKKKGKMAEGKKPVGNAKRSNMIPFSGKGVLLGGSQPSSSPKSPEPVWKRPFPSPVSSPKRPPFSPPPRNKLGSPTDAFLDSLGKNSSGTLPLNKPPTKRSVGNTKYFVSINGSPVRGAAGAASVSAVPSRKRSWDERGGTPNLLDFFSKKAGGSGLPQGQERVTGSGASAVSGSSGEHQKTATATVTSSTAPNSSSHFPSSSAASSSSTALPNTSCSSSVPLPLMVSCPVCQVKVQESKINEHLDSCLYSTRLKINVFQSSCLDWN
uniref:DNA-dependent metalloprotease SPRTN n=1 Tax=Gadus morhua TaxID=8049 RepID=A0A8C5C909_GADMO